MSESKKTEAAAKAQTAPPENKAVQAPEEKKTYGRAVRQALMAPHGPVAKHEVFECNEQFLKVNGSFAARATQAEYEECEKAKKANAFEAYVKERVKAAS